MYIAHTYIEIPHRQKQIKNLKLYILITKLILKMF